MYASKKMAKIRQNRHIRQADFTLTNSTRIRQEFVKIVNSAMLISRDEFD